MVEKEQIEKLAKLAKLKLSDKELEKLTGDMVEIINFADMINTAVSSDGEQKGKYTERRVRIEDLRPDVAMPSYPVEEILSGVGGGENGFFPVKKRKVNN